MPQGLRIATRCLGRRPAFVLGVWLSLALGVGANTTIFSLVNALWLRPTAVVDPGRLGVVYRQAPSTTDERQLMPSMPLHLVRPLADLPGLAGVTYEVRAASPAGEWLVPRFFLRDGRELRAAVVGHEYFTVLGVTVRGASFEAIDEADDRRIVIVSEALAVRLWGEVESALGRTLDTHRGPVTVRGVASKGFGGPRLEDRFDVWVPLGSMDRIGQMPLTMTRFLSVTPFVRLAPGIRWHDVVPAIVSTVGSAAHVWPLSDLRFGATSLGKLVRQGHLIRMLVVTAALMLTAAYATVVGMMLVRSEERRGEFAVRRALGARPWALAAVVGHEVFVLAVTSVPLVLVMQQVITASLGRVSLPSGLPVSSLDLSVDWRVAVVTVVATLVVLSLAALTAATNDLRETARCLIVSPSGPSRRSVRRCQVFLTLQSATAVAVLIGAGALASRIATAVYAAQGVDLEATLLITPKPHLGEYLLRNDANESLRLEQDFADLVTRMRYQPGVQRISYGDAPVPTGDTISLVSLNSASRILQLPVAMARGGPDYAATIGADVIAGRDLAARDLRSPPNPGESWENAPPQPVLIEAALAAELWSDEPVRIGQVFSIGRRQYQVIGIVGNLLPSIPRRLKTAIIVVGVNVSGRVGQVLPSIIVRGRGAAGDMVGSLAAMAQAAFLGRTDVTVRSLRQVMADALGPEYLGATLFGWFSVVATVLAIAGVWGLAAFVVYTSRRALAIRAALGCPPGRLVSATARSVITPVVLGTGCGVGLTMTGLRLIDVSIVGLDRVDTLTYAVSVAVFLTVAAVAAVASIGRAGTPDLRLALS